MAMEKVKISADLFRRYEDSLADNNLDAIVQQLRPMKEWFATESLQAPKAARSRWTKYCLAEDDSSPVVLPGFSIESQPFPSDVATLPSVR
jgi:hypothetical protein